MKSDYSRGLINDYERLIDENNALREETKKLKHITELLQKEYEINEQDKKIIADMEKEITALKNEILRLNGILNKDSSNSGISTGKTPINKNKRVPNSRKKSGKKKGGQNGHKKASLESFEEIEITDHEEHTLDSCPNCGGTTEKCAEEVTKDETDYEVVVVKRRHHYPMYRCTKCGKMFHAPIANTLKEANQYGAGVKSLALLLMNTGNVSVNKVRRMIYGLSEGYINPSEGYIVKQQKTAAKALSEFTERLRERIIQCDLLHWDDTVIMVHQKRACLRVYCTDRLALYKAHMHKDKGGLDEDKILNLLPETATVMHDHNTVNYNEMYVFNNIECNAHLLRDLEYIVQNIPEHTWAKDLLSEINRVYEARKEAIGRGESEFPEEYTEEFFRYLDKAILKGMLENRSMRKNYYADKERALTKRIMDYKDNYFAWIVNFEYPFTNNLSERSLRAAKSKMKISGQFESEQYAQYYAAIRSYIETCYRNGKNEYTALRRLCDGNPYTLDEVLS